MNIDIEKLREDLKDYFGTAAFGPFPQAIIDLTKVERANPQELVNIAKQNNIDLNNYLKDEIDIKTKRLK